MDGWYGRIYRGCGFFDADKPIAKFTKRELDALLYKEPPGSRSKDQRVTYGADPQDPEDAAGQDVDAMQPHPGLRGTRGRIRHVRTAAAPA